MESQKRALRGVAEHISRSISHGYTIGLGSGSTVAALLEELAPLLLARKLDVLGVPTSTQIEMVAARMGFNLTQFQGRVDFVIDGADQVDADLNLIKGGGGALLREKVLMGNSGGTAVVAAENKFVRRLCENGVRVPIEVLPYARKSAKIGLSKLGGVPEERLLPKGYPYFTENGNVILDTAFEPIEKPRELEKNAKVVPGVAEVGIFTFKPITVYRLLSDGSFDVFP
jgi:ribose 5-phosphate isomerase A